MLIALIRNYSIKNITHGLGMKMNKKYYFFKEFLICSLPHLYYTLDLITMLNKK